DCGPVRRPEHGMAVVCGGRRGGCGCRGGRSGEQRQRGKSDHLCPPLRGSLGDVRRQVTRTKAANGSTGESKPQKGCCRTGFSCGPPSLCGRYGSQRANCSRLTATDGETS